MHRQSKHERWRWDEDEIIFKNAENPTQNLELEKYNKNFRTYQMCKIKINAELDKITITYLKYLDPNSSSSLLFWRYIGDCSVLILYRIVKLFAVDMLTPIQLYTTTAQHNYAVSLSLNASLLLLDSHKCKCSSYSHCSHRCKVATVHQRLADTIIPRLCRR